MSTQTLSVGNNDGIEIQQVGGNLSVEGWDRQELQARGDVLRVEPGAGQIVVSSAGDLTLSVPRRARVLLGTVGGDLLVQNLEGSVELNLVGGDAELRNLGGPVRLNGTVGGETRLENVGEVLMNSGRAGDRFSMAERVMRRAEHAARRAEAKIRRAERHFHGFERGAGSGSEAPDSAVAAGGPTDEERMAILRMLQDKKITSEQAEKLLSALEGNA